MRKVLVTNHAFDLLDIEQRVLNPPVAWCRDISARTSKRFFRCWPTSIAVLTQFSPLKAKVIAAMQKARAIVRYGIGVDNVDLKAPRVPTLVFSASILHADHQCSASRDSRDRPSFANRWFAANRS